MNLVREKECLNGRYKDHGRVNELSFDNTIGIVNRIINPMCCNKTVGTVKHWGITFNLINNKNNAQQRLIIKIEY